MRRPRSQRVVAESVRDAAAGDYVELRGVVRAAEPIVGPVSGEALIGYTLVCSVFNVEPGNRLPEYVDRVDHAEWSEVLLEDDSGDVPVALEGAIVRVPALAEKTLDDADAIAALLRRIGETYADPPEQLQLLERGIRDGATVSLTGRVADPPLSGSAYRRSARPRKRVTGVRGAPLVITPS